MLSTPREAIGHQLKVERKLRQYTQADVADAVKTDKAVISRIENGVYTGSLKVLERYLDHLGFHLCIEQTVPQRPQFEQLAELFPDE